MTLAPTLNPELASYRAQFFEIKQRAGSLVRGLAETAMRWTPAAGRWSIEECLLHLTRVGLWHLPLLDDAIQRTQANAQFGNGPFRHPAVTSWLVRLVEPPPKFGVKVPGVFKYHPAVDGTRAVPGFMELQDALVDRVEAASGLDITRVKITSPVTSLLRLTIGQLFGFLAAHERRHLWQIEQVKASPGFPHA